MSGAITQIDGLFWPIDDEDARPVILRDCEPSIERLLAHFTGRDCIVQAGANIGLYPLVLADHFQSVITAEPDPTNFDCLRRNLEARDDRKRITAVNAAFGAEAGSCSPLEVEPRNCGAHRVSFGKGSVAVITIDSLGLEACDCIWLDVEGAELPALQGAHDTVERFSPIIAAEDKGLHRAFGIADGELQQWLGARGYEQVDKIGNDKILRRNG